MKKQGSHALGVSLVYEVHFVTGSLTPTKTQLSLVSCTNQMCLEKKPDAY